MPSASINLVQKSKSQNRKTKKSDEEKTYAKAMEDDTGQHKKNETESGKFELQNSRLLQTFSIFPVKLCSLKNQ